MTSDVVALIIMAPGLLLWALLGALLWRLRRRRRMVPGAVRVVLVTGLGSSAYPVAAAAGVDLPRWALVPGLVVALVTGYGFMIYQLRKHRATIHGPWPEHPDTIRWREQHAERATYYRAVVDRLNMTDSDRAGVDAPAHDETETR